MAKLDYEPRLVGAPGSEAEELLKSVAQSFILQDQPPPTLGLLNKRAKNDIPAMLQGLKSLGYYLAKIRVKIKKDPIELLFKINPGPLFKVSKVDIKYEPAPDILPSIKPSLDPGQPALALDVVESQQNILKDLQTQGYPFPKCLDRKVVVDVGNYKMRVVYIIDCGQYAKFGQSKIIGAKTVEPEYIRFLLAWEPGQVYDVSLLSKARNKLVKTGLFSLVRMKPLPLSSASHSVDIAIDVTERKKKTFKVGGGYSSDLGILGSMSWENRNILGAGEKLKFSLEGSKSQKKVDAEMRKPWFWEQDQVLIAGSSFEEKDTLAYYSKSIQIMSALQRQILTKLKGSIGLRYRLSEVRDDEGKESYGHVSVPVSGIWNGLNDLLNPTRGLLISGEFAPYFDTLNEDSGFTKLSASVAWHLPVLPPHFVLSCKGSWGEINGVGLEQVPADIRFYAGGGGSIRGYAYQMAGDLDEDDKPVGGLSLLEFSAELRYRFLKNYGLAAFIDGGRAYTEQLLDPKKKLFWGTGLGFLYYTPIGPIRLDIAFPLYKRPDIDADYQIYVGLGQAY